MARTRTIRLVIPVLLMGAISVLPGSPGVYAQITQSVTQSLLDKAHALEVRGRMDMASQTWQQVLLADPNNAEALAGLARAAKLAGNTAQTNQYLDRLRAINPSDPNIARVESMGTQQSQQAQLQQAAKLAQVGQYGQAITIYRQVFGSNPPAGDWAMAYYETESATEDGRPHAIEGLRSLIAKNPGESRYQIALGRILTYNPVSRAEGRKILERYPKDPQAIEALRQSLVWDSQNPATAGQIRAYLARHPDTQLEQALKNQPIPTRSSRQASRPLTPEEEAEAQVAKTRTAEEQEAYRALNARHLDEAERRFKAILDKRPESGPALAGMGYIRMQQANFGGAISFLDQAKQDGTDDAGLENALGTARFWYTMGEGQSALGDGDLSAAERKFQAALTMRPASPEALEGLGGTLLKAEQSEPAAQVFDRYIKVKPSAPAAWLGLFSAQLASGNAAAALQTEQRVPATVRVQLMKDPDYLRALASAYSATGRDADAQRVLHTALDLPFPAGAQGLKADTQLQYASLLQQANHLEQAAGLYRQVLLEDNGNVNAWQGMVRVEHAMVQDPVAIQTIESMPPAVYASAMRDPGFETTVAAIYQGQGKLDIAQDLLEKAIAQQTTSGQKVAVPVQVQLAGIYLQRNQPLLAYPIYQRVLSQNPERLDAWKGLLSALHTNGRDTEVLAQVQQIPPAVRSQLETDPDYLQTIGATYNSLGQPKQARVFLARVQQYYAQRHTAPPADIEIQNGWLLFNSGDDAGLYQQLMALGTRTDLTEEQRHTIQSQWTGWAVRRANQAAAMGDNKRSLAILNAAARAFPDNPGVTKALAGGYARAGLPKQAVAIFKAQDMTQTTASDYKAAVGAALAAGDNKDAETWLRYGLDAYPRDAQMLVLAAKFEQARGDNARASEYYRASLAAMPPPDPGAELATELSRPVPASEVRLPGATHSQDLAALLSPGTPSAQTSIPRSSPPPSSYLPSYSNAYGTAPVELGGQSSVSNPGTEAASQIAVPSYMDTKPTRQSRTKPAAPVTPTTRLKDYVPQSFNTRPATLDDFVLPSTSHTGTTVSVPSLSASEMGVAEFEQQHGFQAIPVVEQAHSRVAAGVSSPTSFETSRLAYQRQQVERATQQAQAELPAAQPSLQAAETVYGAYVPYVAPANVVTKVDLGERLVHVPLPQPEVTDVLPTARYAKSSRPGNPAANRPELAAARAAAIRRSQSNPNLVGQSHPPEEDLNTTVTENAQYSSQPYNPAQAQADQLSRPAVRPSTTKQQNAQDLQPQNAPPAAASAEPRQMEDSDSQQYPQPIRRRPTSAAPRRRTLPAPQTNAAPPAPGLNYPPVAESLSSQPFPDAGQPLPLPAAPTDADLIAKSVPPLRGSYTAQVPLPRTRSEREQAELDLATLEASYSGWVGGTGYARYRSGTLGLDRLTDLESPIEFSAVLGKNVRATIIPRPVFLNSGSLDVTAFQGVTGTVPILGTFPANALNAPAQQFSSGIGGEGQLTTTNFGIAIGYTPYEFLVHNFTGRLRYRPGGGHFTILVDRDSIKETQLSYAGLRDPGTATPVFGGNIWGGVVSTGGAIRFDTGDEHSGFYVSVGGASLNGYHVLDNTTFNGTAGAYFRVKVFPEYGSLNVGGSIYGSHFANNERGLTYGKGGYFSPSAYFLASVPVTFNGHYKTDFHYVVAGSAGLQTFQEDSSPYYPLDPTLQLGAVTSCSLTTIAAKTCGFSPVNSNTGANYAINVQGSYRIADHWYVGGFLSGNNTNNYNTVNGGFFLRYLFRPQFPTEEAPTGLFPLEGFRPLRVP